MKNFLLNKPNDMSRKSVFWNIVANSLNSIISIILLWAVTHINGTNDAGVFSLGFSTAQMMLTVGNFGMRNYQATDVSNKYSQETYVASMWFTSFIMIICTFFFLAFKKYYLEKSLIVLLMCILKVTDALDDVYGGYYQKMNRLDLSGKILFLRIIEYSLAFLIVLGLTHNMCLAIIIAIIVSSVSLVWMVSVLKKLFPVAAPDFSWLRIKGLLKECIPLCISAFLLVYMGNAPKYAIDSYLSNNMQAIYNFLFMPCFVINLFVGFVLQPLLVKLSVLWKENRFCEFKKICAIIYSGTVIIGIIIIACGHFFGCPLLSLFFGVDLNSYQNILTILLLGGAIFALASITQTILTVMRHQYSILWGFAISNVLITIFAPVLVRQLNLQGASWSYTIAACVLFIVLLICFFFFWREKAVC